MAFDRAFLKAIGGQDNREFGGNVWSYSHPTDLLSVILLDNYFLEAEEELNNDDIILSVHPAGEKEILVTESLAGSVKAKAKTNPSIQVLVAPGAIDLNTDLTTIALQNTGDAFTLADGYGGQEKIVLVLTESAASDTGILTPASRHGYTSILLDITSGFVKLLFFNGAWGIVAFNTVDPSIAPTFSKLLTFDLQITPLVLPISLTTDVTLLNTTAAAAPTLAVGTEGQQKRISLIIDGGTATITVAGSGAGVGTIIMADIFDSVELVFALAAWHMLSSNGAPVIT